MARNQSRSRFALLAGTVLACWVLVAPARAEKNPFNVSAFGNLYISFTDFTTQGGLGMGTRRIYNSFDYYRMGRFGVGWSNQAETYLTVESDGSILIHEYGGGAENAFQPTTSSTRASNDVIDEIMQAAEKSGKFGSQADRAAYRQWLETGTNRETAWASFAKMGLVKEQDPPVGETFFSGAFYTEYITRVPEGYQRKMKYTGGVYFQAFDNNGRLTRYWDTSHNYIALLYAGNGSIAQAYDNLGDRSVFSATSDGHVTRISCTPNHLLLYTYKPASAAFNQGSYDLVSVSVDAKVTQYGYDRNDQLTSVTYPDKTSMHVSYDAEERVASITDTDGTSTSYTYGLTTTASSKIYTFENKIRKPNGETHDNLFRYYYDAPSYNKDKVEETDDGALAKTTTYDANGDELATTTPKGTTQFQYDSLDREIFEKQPSGRTLTWQYDLATGNVAVVTITDKNTVVTEHFNYDPEGDLIRAYDTAGHDFTLAYDDHGRVASVTGSALNLGFSYADSRATKPATVMLAGTGSISVTYLADGNVAKAQSSQGSGVVDKVRAALNTVDDLISEAGFDVLTLPVGGA